ncbi:MAG: hypothetical protein H5U07_09405, partial [Candidatus Aminicenantes bacterium]|nr:hypothetical protein [Candidatus Aminicenantes bacterium]
MNSLSAKIEEYRRLFQELASKINESRGVEELRQTFLGRKKGHLTLLFEELRNLPAEDKKTFGRAINEFKKEVEEKLAELEQKFSQKKKERIIDDLTLPGKEIYWGAPHPLTVVALFVEVEEVAGLVAL